MLSFCWSLRFDVFNGTAICFNVAVDVVYYIYIYCSDPSLAGRYCMYVCVCGRPLRPGRDPLPLPH